ncbi:MAG: hypothetical protein NT075_21265 [Chloroflexi bacterium]|nr:hypothetical protein [Chloroflexota bacterium]
MTIGQTSENIPILILLALAYLPALFLLIGLGALLRSLLRIQGAYFGIGFVLLLLFGPPIAASLYLDTVGQVAPAQVTKRVETIRYREEGDWRHNFTLSIQYVTTTQQDATANFSPDEATFDHLHEGETILVRTVNVGRWISLVRFANQSTLTWLPWWWIGAGLALVGLGVGFWLLTKVPFGWVAIIVILLALATYPLLAKLNEGQRSQDPSLTPLRATATIQAVERVTEFDPLPSNRSGDSDWETRIDAPQPYDIVTLRFTPQGYEQTVLGVDAVDANSVVVQPDTQVEIAYGSRDPRTVHLLQGTRTHYWKNPLGWVQQQIYGLVLIVLLLLGFGWLTKRAGQWWKTRVEQRA